MAGVDRSRIDGVGHRRLLRLFMFCLSDASGPLRLLIRSLKTQLIEQSDSLVCLRTFFPFFNITVFELRRVFWQNESRRGLLANIVLIRSLVRFVGVYRLELLLQPEVQEMPAITAIRRTKLARPCLDHAPDGTPLLDAGARQSCRICMQGVDGRTLAGHRSTPGLDARRGRRCQAGLSDFGRAS